MSKRTREQQISYNYGASARQYEKRARFRENIRAVACDPESLFAMEDNDDPSV